MTEPIELADVLEPLEQKYGMLRIALAVEDGFKTWLHREKPDFRNKQDAYLDLFQARSLFRRITAVTGGHASGNKLVVGDLVDFIKRVKMPPEALLAAFVAHKPFPFKNFERGRVLTVFVAKRMAYNDEGEGKEAKWKRAAHGSRDVQAIADLTNLMSRTLNLEYELNLVAVEQGTAIKEEDAMAILNKHLKSPATGAIVSLGSGPHNAVSNVMAKLIFKDYEPPARFRWTGKSRPKVDFLWEGPGLKELEKECKAGIWSIQNGRAVLLPRDTDKSIKLRYSSPQAGGRRPHLFDCGMLAIDASKRVPLILAAGHGGNATRACIQALERTEVIETAVQKSLKTGCFVGCLVVSRVKASKEVKDDVKLVEKRGDGRSWYFYGLEDPPKGYGFRRSKPISVELPPQDGMANE